MTVYLDLIYSLLFLLVYLTLCILAGRYTRPREVRSYLNNARTMRPHNRR